MSLSDITIPIFTGVIGYITNWTGVWMLFNPVHFKGFRFPGLAPLARVLPRKLQEVPGIVHGADANRRGDGGRRFACGRERIRSRRALGHPT